MEMLLDEFGALEIVVVGHGAVAFQGRGTEGSGLILDRLPDADRQSDVLLFLLKLSFCLHFDKH